MRAGPACVLLLAPVLSGCLAAPAPRDTGPSCAAAWASFEGPISPYDDPPGAALIGRLNGSIDGGPGWSSQASGIREYGGGAFDG